MQAFEQLIWLKNQEYFCSLQTVDVPNLFPTLKICEKILAIDTPPQRGSGPVGQYDGFMGAGTSGPRLFTRGSKKVQPSKASLNPELHQLDARWVYEEKKKAVNPKFQISGSINHLQLINTILEKSYETTTSEFKSYWKEHKHYYYFLDNLFISAGRFFKALPEGTQVQEMDIVKRFGHQPPNVLSEAKKWLQMCLTEVNAVGPLLTNIVHEEYQVPLLMQKKAYSKTNETAIKTSDGSWQTGLQNAQCLKTIDGAQRKEELKILSKGYRKTQNKENITVSQASILEWLSNVRLDIPKTPGDNFANLQVLQEHERFESQYAYVIAQQSTRAFLGATKHTVGADLGGAKLFESLKKAQMYSASLTQTAIVKVQIAPVEIVSKQPGFASAPLEEAFARIEAKNIARALQKASIEEVLEKLSSLGIDTVLIEQVKKNHQEKKHRESTQEQAVKKTRL